MGRNGVFMIQHFSEAMKWSGELAQLVRVFTTKFDDLSLIPRHHLVEEENP